MAGLIEVLAHLRKPRPQVIRHLAGCWLSSVVVGLLLFVPALATEAVQERSKSSVLERQWREQNIICLDGEQENEGPQTPRMKTACHRRNAIMEALRDLDRCYGRRVGIGHVMEWHDCEADSLTYALPPKLRR